MKSSNYWQSIFVKRMNRRRLLRGAAAGGLGLAAAAAIGCGEEEETAQTPPGTSTAPAAQATAAATGTAAATVRHNTGYTAEQVEKMSLEEAREAFHGKYLRDLWGNKRPKYGGVYKMASVTPVPITYDTTKIAGTQLASWSYFWNQLVDFEIGDFATNPNFHILDLDLAQSYEQPDPLTIVFSLHQNVFFHDVPPVNGRQMTAEDVKYVTEIYMKSPGQEGAYVDVDSVEAVDANTVRFRFKEPAAYFLGKLTELYHFIFPREQYEAGIMDRQPIGTGAFIYESGEVGVGLKVVKNPKYFKKDKWTGMQLPYLDRYEAVFAADPAASLSLFRTKQTDRQGLANVTQLLELLKTTPDVVIQMTAPPNSYQPFVSMNLANQPWSDVRVRRALSMAVDRDLIINNINKGFGAYGAPLSWHFFGQEWPWTPDQLGENFKYNPERAKQILTEAGYGDGFSAEFANYPGYNVGAYGDTFLATLDMWRKNLNIQSEVKLLEQAEFFNQYYSVKYKDMAATGIIGPAMEPHSFVWDATHSTSPKNYWNIKDPKNDEFALKQRRELDTEKRKQILLEWFKYDTDNVTRMWIINVYRLSARHPYVYNAADEVDAWEPGWGSKVRDKVWKDV